LQFIAKLKFLCCYHFDVLDMLCCFNESFLCSSLNALLQDEIANASVNAIMDVHGKAYTPGQLYSTLCKSAICE